MVFDRKEHNSKPEIKARIKERTKEYREKNKVSIRVKRKEYRSRPEIKAKRKEQGKEYRSRPDVKVRRTESYRKWIKIPGVKDKRIEYAKKYRDNNKGIIKKKSKEYRNKNKKRISEWSKEYYQRPEVNKRRKDIRSNSEFKIKRKKWAEEFYEKNKEKISRRGKEFYEKNKEKISRRGKEYYEENRDKIKIRSRKYYQNNKHNIKVIERRKEYVRDPKNKKRKQRLYNQRLKIDIPFRIKEKLRVRSVMALKSYLLTGKQYTSKEYGIDFTAIIEQLKPFPKDIENYHIDHIIPLSWFDFNNPKEIQWAFSPENHQWLTKEENLWKGHRFIWIKN